MKNEKEKIDLLLEKNTAEQLAKVDWESLNTAISARLDEAQQSKASAIKFATVFKIAAGITAAAAILIVVMVGIERTPDLQLQSGRAAVVKFIETKGSALVKIKHASVKPDVFVDIGGSRRELAKCDIEIIDANGDLKEKANRAAWIIISRPEPVYADNGVSTDMMDVMYLF